jgi:hypothetical protein
VTWRWVCAVVLVVSVVFTVLVILSNADLQDEEGDDPP